MGTFSAEPFWTDVGLFWIGLATIVVVLVTSVMTLGILIRGAFYGVKQVNTAFDQLQATHAQLGLVKTSTALEAISVLAARWDSELLIKARRLVNDAGANLIQTIDEYEAANSEEYYAITALFGFFEELGYLCKTHDELETITNYVRKVFDGPVQYYFPLFGEYIERERKKRLYDRKFAEYFEALAGLVKE